MTDLVKLADQYAEEKHSGQTDKAGLPYIGHPRAVAAKLSGETEKIVALLHDTVEDTDATIEEIRALFGDEAADAVQCLTHEKGVPYMEYVARIRENPLARKVKMADLTHNMDTSRLPEITERDLQRLEKYKAAYEMLKEEEASGESSNG